MAKVNTGSKVIILGAHPYNGYSMRRYTALLEDTYKFLGYDTTTLVPSNALSKHVGPGPLRKLLVYVEKLAFFPIRFATIPRGAHVHLADHSDGIWLLVPTLAIHDVWITCHDLFAIMATAGELPEHRPRISGRIYQNLIRAGIAKARQIVSVSHATDADVKRYFKATSSTVVHNPIDASFQDAPEMRPGGYALIVGPSSWRKRRDLAIEAWIRLRRAADLDTRLTIVGPQLDGMERAVLLREGLSTDLVTITADISETGLLQTYAGADYVLVASKYEGFAWPILEANAVGVPVLCADEQILRETGEGNVFFDPSLDANDWLSLHEMLSSLRNSEDLRTRALGFSRARFAKVLKQAIQTHSPSR